VLLLAELAEKAAGNENFVTQTLGAALYRIGRYDDATEILQSEPGEGYVAAYAGFFLAMAQAKLENDEEAQQSFDQAVALAEQTDDTRAKQPEDTRQWYCSVRLAVLRDEVEALLNGSNVPDPAKTPTTIE